MSSGTNESVGMSFAGGAMTTIVDRPGYFGKKRDRKIEFYNNLFGEDKWKECWEVEGKILCFCQAVALYDAAYLAFLQSRPDLVTFITSFGECYDNDPSNMACGLNHDEHSCPRHIQDISVRRAIHSLGVWFTGGPDNLLEIRGEGSNGSHLNPGQVPFHRPELILRSEKAGKCPTWAGPDSVEAFWQTTKVIVTDSNGVTV